MRSSVLAFAVLIFLPIFAHAQVCDSNAVRVTTTPAPPQVAYALRKHFDLAKHVPARADVVILGDSLVAGFPPRLLASAFPGKDVLNYGDAADQVQNTNWRIKHSVLSGLRPRLVFVLVGTNNLLFNPPCAIIDGYAKLLGTLKKVWPDSEIVPIEIPRRADRFGSMEAKREAVNAGIRQLSQRVISLDGVLCNPSSHCNQYLPDKLHFNALGYERIAEALRSASH